MNVSRAFLVESPTNPRKHFNEQKLAELTANVRLHGVLQPLMVRPRWCVGVATRDEIERLTGRSDLQSTPFEIVAGARRKRAADGAELATVPCSVRFFTDAEAFDIQLIENLQRDDLTPTEEAQGYHDALQLRIDGKPVHTVASLAERLNKEADHIHEWMLLVRLSKELRSAVDSGVLPVTQAAKVARVPDEAQRAEAGAKVLHGHGENQPLSVSETRELIAREYRRELKGAPFDQENPLLCQTTIPGGVDHGKWSGKCSDCPHRSGNIPGFATKRGARTDICTNPTCYAAKADTAFALVRQRAEEQGKKVLTTAEAARHFDPLGALVFTTTLVRESEKPAEHLLKMEVKRAPTWAALAATAREAGLEVPVFVARNPKTGIVEELIDSAPLIAAAKKIGEPIFRGGKEDEPLLTTKKPGEDDDDAFKRGQRELAAKHEADTKKAGIEAQLREVQTMEALKRIHASLRKYLPALPSARQSLLEELLPEYLDAAGVAGLRLMAKAFGVKPGPGVFGHADAMESYIRVQKSLLEPLCVLLLVANSAAAEGLNAGGMVALARVLGLDLKEIVQPPAAKKEPPKKKPTKRKPVSQTKRSVAAKSKKGGAK